MIILNNNGRMEFLKNNLKIKYIYFSWTKNRYRLIQPESRLNLRSIKISNNDIWVWKGILDWSITNDSTKYPRRKFTGTLIQ